jgi:chromatin remodeling complex protein RSC6
MNIMNREPSNIDIISAKAEAVITANLAMNAADKQATEAMNISLSKKDVVEQIKDLINGHTKMYELHKKHTKHLKELLKEVKKVQKNAKKEEKKEKKKAKKEKTSNKNETPIKLNGLTRPMSVTKELSSFLNKPLDTKMSRVGTAKEVAKYIKKKKLNKEENKMYWVPDETLQSILEPLNEKDKEKGGYSYFNLQRYISHLFIKE